MDGSKEDTGAAWVFFQNMYSCGLGDSLLGSGMARPGLSGDPGVFSTFGPAMVYGHQMGGHRCRAGGSGGLVGSF